MSFNQLKTLRELPGPIMVTGHTGFKGSWLSLLLKRLDIPFIGYSLAPQSDSLFMRIKGPNSIPGEIGDVRDLRNLGLFIEKYKPAAIMHMAAQPLVLESYASPLETFDINVMGTANILELGSYSSFIKSIIVVTTDKVYKNIEDGVVFRENDPLEGRDPYSASKVAAESAVNAWREIAKLRNKSQIISVRAGNVIGGGDWAENRLLPDIVRAFNDAKPLIVRNPESTRPWQHVLDPLVGYLLLMSKSLKSKDNSTKTMNFGPSENGLSVREVVLAAQSVWQKETQVEYKDDKGVTSLESQFLNLDSTVAKSELGWKPYWSQRGAVISTANWWRRHLIDGVNAETLCIENIDELLSN